MSILMWEKPNKVMTTEEWSGISADGAPPGVYVPNMSDEDRNRWKAVLKPKLGQVEIRRSGLVLIVSLDGYVYRSYRTGVHNEMDWQKENRIHLSMNDSQSWTHEEFIEFMQAYDESLTILRAFKIDQKRIKQALKNGEDVFDVTLTVTSEYD